MITSRKTRHVVRWTLDLPAALAEQVEAAIQREKTSRVRWVAAALEAELARQENHRRAIERAATKEEGECTP